MLIIGTNSYVTLTEANDYLSYKWGATAWSGLTDANKEILLVSAYRWLNASSEISLPAVATDAVKYAQIELAWYLYNHYSEHEKRSALVSQGVTDFTISKFSESLTKTGLPEYVKELLSGLLVGGHKIVQLKRSND